MKMFEARRLEYSIAEKVSEGMGLDRRDILRTFRRYGFNGHICRYWDVMGHNNISGVLC